MSIYNVQPVERFASKEGKVIYGFDHTKNTMSVWTVGIKGSVTVPMSKYSSIEMTMRLLTEDSIESI